MYSERTTTTECNASIVQNDNQRTCGKCAYQWLDNRGLPIEKTTCPRCKSTIVRRGLVQSGISRPTKPNVNEISEILDILEFTTGERNFTRRNDIN